MKADSFARPTARVHNGKLEVRGGYTKREELLKDMLAALVGTLEPAMAQSIQPKNAKAFMDSAENLVSAYMTHLSADEGQQYQTLLERHEALQHRLEQLEKSVPFTGDPL